jgi:Kef-type K+ transport system membrane component KefB
MNPSYLIDIIILLSAAVIAVPLFQAIRLGAVPGFLVAGLIVGPSGFCLISNINQISYLAEIGVVLLLFVIGIELKPSRLWLMRRSVFGLGKRVTQKIHDIVKCQFSTDLAGNTELLL